MTARADDLFPIPPEQPHSLIVTASSRWWPMLLGILDDHASPAPRGPYLVLERLEQDDGEGGRNVLVLIRHSTHGTAVLRIGLEAWRWECHKAHTGCPSAECSFCTSAECNQCGVDACEHDVLDRHEGALRPTALG